MATALLSLAGNILSWDLRLTNTLTLYMDSQSNPHRQYCLPVLAHIEPLTFLSLAQLSIKSLRAQFTV